MHIKRKGFTLLELIVSLGVLAIVSGVIFFVISRRDTSYREIMSATYLLMADIRYARQRAIIDGEDVEIVFYGMENRYTIRYFSSWKIIREVRLPDNVWFMHSSDLKYHFRPRGTPSVGFTIDLCTVHHRMSVSVVASGGRVRYHDYREVN